MLFQKGPSLNIHVTSANFLKAHSIQEKVQDLDKRYNVFQKQFDRGVTIDAGAKTDLLLKIQSK